MKWWVLVQLPYYTQGNGSGNYGVRLPGPGAGIVKGREEKRDYVRIPGTIT